MSQSTLVHQYLFCAAGLHRRPPRRDPPGPIVAMCPCCRKMLYCYGLDINTRGVYPSLLLPNYPRVLGPISTVAHLH
jgi:hypothetical protein